MDAPKPMALALEEQAVEKVCSLGGKPQGPSQHIRHRAHGVVEEELAVLRSDGSAVLQEMRFGLEDASGGRPEREHPLAFQRPPTQGLTGSMERQADAPRAASWDKRGVHFANRERAQVLGRKRVRGRERGSALPHASR